MDYSYSEIRHLPTSEVSRPNEWRDSGDRSEPAFCPYEESSERDVVSFVALKFVRGQHVRDTIEDASTQYPSTLSSISRDRLGGPRHDQRTSGASRPPGGEA